LDERNPEATIKNREKIIADVVVALCKPESYEAVIHSQEHGRGMPSVEDIDEAVELLRAVMFPGYFGSSDITPETMCSYIEVSLDRVSRIFQEQIRRGFCFFCDETGTGKCVECEGKSAHIINEFLQLLPGIRHLLATDVAAAYEGDPAASSTDETIFCYPSIRALTNHRLAHELYKMEVPLIPRIISEIAHSETGIDIHPGAQIDEHFFMDHGTGIVIGETSIIGKNVCIYQGVTLGAKSFPKDEDGNPVKGVPRHPIVEDDVTIYAGATILGRITIGKGAVIGGNVWVTDDCPSGSKILQR
jgi:serine O-acetyltransferase